MHRRAAAPESTGRPQRDRPAAFGCPPSSALAQGGIDGLSVRVEAEQRPGLAGQVDGDDPEKVQLFAGHRADLRRELGRRGDEPHDHVPDRVRPGEGGHRRGDRGQMQVTIPVTQVA